MGFQQMLVTCFLPRSHLNCHKGSRDPSSGLQQIKQDLSKTKAISCVLQFQEALCPNSNCWTAASLRRHAKPKALLAGVKTPPPSQFAASLIDAESMQIHEDQIPAFLTYDPQRPMATTSAIA